MHWVIWSVTTHSTFSHLSVSDGYSFLNLRSPTSGVEFQPFQVWRLLFVHFLKSMHAYIVFQHFSGPGIVYNLAQVLVYLLHHGWVASLKFLIANPILQLQKAALDSLILSCRIIWLIQLTPYCRRGVLGLCFVRFMHRWSIEFFSLHYCQRQVSILIVEEICGEKFWVGIPVLESRCCKVTVVCVMRICNAHEIQLARSKWNRVLKWPDGTCLKGISRYSKGTCPLEVTA